PIRVATRKFVPCMTISHARVFLLLKRRGSMINIPRGTQDILPEETKKWRYIEAKLDQLMELYNYEEIRTPIFESTELFARGVGGSTDVVQKEMYTFKDKGDRSITLRPEGTAAVVRSY